jgi:hypothetical protein
MDKRAVISVTALLVLGAGIAVFWRKLEREPAVDTAQGPGEPAAAMNSGTAAAPVSEQLLAEKLRASQGDGAQAAAPQAEASPEILQKRAQARNKLMAAYPELATTLQLTPEQAEQFLDLLARQQVEIAELIAARPGEIRDGVYSQRLARDVNIMELSDDAEQTALLEGKYPEWLQYQQDEIFRNPVDQLQGVLQRQGIGIADADADALVTALAAEQTRFSKEMARTSGSPGDSPRELLQQQLHYAANNRQLVKVASRYLNTQQLEAYEQLLERRTLTAQRLLRNMGGETGE